MQQGHGMEKANVKSGTALFTGAVDWRVETNANGERRIRETRLMNWSWNFLVMLGSSTAL